MKANDPSKTVREELYSATGAANQAWESAREKATDALASGERYVRGNPGTSVLSVFGLGFILGLLVGWSVAHEEHDDYATSARKFVKRWGRKLNLD